MGCREEKIQQLSEEKYQLLQDIGGYGRLILELEKELNWSKLQDAGQRQDVSLRGVVEDVAKYCRYFFLKLFL